MINRVSFKYGDKFNDAQAAAQKTVEQVGNTLIGLQDLVIPCDDYPGVDKNPQRGEIDMKHTFQQMNLAVKGKASYEPGCEPSMKSMDMTFENTNSGKASHIKFQESTAIDENGDGKKEAQGQLIQITDQNNVKTTVMMNEKTDVITLIEEK